MYSFELLLMVSDATLILSGVTMYWFSPRLKRNWALGYGSPRSMINDSTWQTANRFAGMSMALIALTVMALHVTLWPVINGSDKVQALTVAALLSVPLAVMYL